MDEYSGKRAVGGLLVPRKSSRLVLRDTADNRDGNAQFCNRLGCNGRLNYTRGTEIGSSEKLKSLRPSFRSSSGKEVIGSSSRTCSVPTNARKTVQESRRKLTLKLEIDSSESSNVQDESEVQQLILSPRTVQTGFQELRGADSRKVTLIEAGSSNLASRPRNSFRQKSGLTNQDAPLGSPSSAASSSSKNTGQGTRVSANANRYGLNSLRCSSISDVLQRGCSSSESNVSKRRDIVKKRSPEGESSSSVRGMKTSGPSSENIRVSLPTNGISLSDSRRHRNWPLSRESSVASVRTRRSINSNIGTSHSSQANGNNLSLIDSSTILPQMPQSEILFDMSNTSPLYLETSSSRSSSHSHSQSNDNVDNLMPVTSAEHGVARLMNHDGSRRYNMDGIAEVLLALERIERDEELTYEQLLALEANLFLGGLGFYDQHRDMRLDIDNMSYEELLALEEKMGTVSTALSEEALLKSLRRNTHQTIHTKDGAMGCNTDGDEVKCSICQEDYVTGDEVGRLGCEHGYHMGCIKQWLRLKNWCPICKASVAPSESSQLS